MHFDSANGGAVERRASTGKVARFAATRLERPIRRALRPLPQTGPLREARVPRAHRNQLSRIALCKLLIPGGPRHAGPNARQMGCSIKVAKEATLPLDRLSTTHFVALRRLFS